MSIERDHIEIIIGLLGLIRDKNKGANLSIADMEITERADALVFLSEESCQWCGGRVVTQDGNKCPECGGTGLR